MKSSKKRSGFTLIELLIVTVVIVTLMGVVFRLAGVGGDNRARSVTIDRLQRLENALSGYYAAYGSYPPVPLQGRSRSIYKKVDGFGVQESGEDETGNTSLDQMETMCQIEAACRAQPLSMSWPGIADGDTKSMIEDISSGCKDAGISVYNCSFEALRGTGSLKLDEVDWRGTGKSGKGVQLFEFGLLSFLFPRYLLMLEGGMDEFYDHKKNRRFHSQWAANNQLPCRLDDGDPYGDWKTVRKDLGVGQMGGSGRREAGMISNLTSQAVCARWMPNFKGIVSTLSTAKYRYFYGVDVYDGDRPYMQLPSRMSSNPCGLKGSGVLWNHRLRVFSQSGYSGSSSGGGSAYLLFSMTVYDGWHREFYYYSDSPYQSYRLWSAGPNGVTFPPWYDLDQFSGKDLNSIQKFIEDDVVHLSN